MQHTHSGVYSAIKKNGDWGDAQWLKHPLFKCEDQSRIPRSHINAKFQSCEVESRISRASWRERLAISVNAVFDASKNQVEKQ